MELAEGSVEPDKSVPTVSAKRPVPRHKPSAETPVSAYKRQERTVGSALTYALRGKSARMELVLHHAHRVRRTAAAPASMCSLPEHTVELVEKPARLGKFAPEEPARFLVPAVKGTVGEAVSRWPRTGPTVEDATTLAPPVKSVLVGSVRFPVPVARPTATGLVWMSNPTLVTVELVVTFVHKVTPVQKGRASSHVKTDSPNALDNVSTHSPIGHIVELAETLASKEKSALVGLVW